MTQKLLKAKKRKIVPKKTSGDQGRGRPAKKKIVLVGTYAGEQLKEWPGYYPYPLYGKDKIDPESAKKVNEIWLFKGTKEPKYFAAECLGVKTRAELKALGYPAKGKGHGDGTYLLFKIEKTYAPANASAALAASVESVIVRTKDEESASKEKKYCEYSENGTVCEHDLVPTCELESYFTDCYRHHTSRRATRRMIQRYLTGDSINRRLGRLKCRWQST